MSDTEGGGKPELPPAVGGSEAEPAGAPAAVWRTRALSAEARAEQLSKEVESLRTELSQAKAAHAELQARHELEAELLKARAIDVDAALALVQRDMPPGAKPQQAVADLRRRKPQLFRGVSSASGAMAPEPGDSGRSGIRAAAERALVSGDRRSVLSYLRARRGG